MKLQLYCLNFLYFTEEMWKFKNSATVPNMHINFLARYLEQIFCIKSSQVCTWQPKVTAGFQNLLFFQTHLTSMQIIYCVIPHRCSQTPTFPFQHCKH